jgi:hypothetical protein
MNAPNQSKQQFEFRRLKKTVNLQKQSVVLRTRGVVIVIVIVIVIVVVVVVVLVAVVVLEGLLLVENAALLGTLLLHELVVHRALLPRHLLLPVELEDQRLRLLLLWRLLRGRR